MSQCRNGRVYRHIDNLTRIHVSEIDEDDSTYHTVVVHVGCLPNRRVQCPACLSLVKAIYHDAQRYYCRQCAYICYHHRRYRVTKERHHFPHLQEVAAKLRSINPEYNCMLDAIAANPSITAREVRELSERAEDSQKDFAYDYLLYSLRRSASSRRNAFKRHGL